MSASDFSRWWTWAANLPAEMRHLDSGFSLTPAFYAASTGKLSFAPPGKDVRPGARAFDDSSCDLTLSHGGTVLDWRYRMDRSAGLKLNWRCEKHGEWGLRYWVILVLQQEAGAIFHYDAARKSVTAESATHRFELTSAKAPLLVTKHDSLDALKEEYESRGYFYLASRAKEGPLLALRFNLEEAPQMQVHVSLTAKAPQSAKVAPALPAPGKGAAQEALEALHDVAAWQQVYDFVNKRPYTCLTRYWNTVKFGGFGVWMTDVFLHALIWSHFDAGRACENIDAVFAYQQPAGNFACLVTGNDAWIDRSHPPIGSYVVRQTAARAGDQRIAAKYFDGLLRNYDWWWARRTLAGTGLVAYGTSKEVGQGLYIGTKLGAKDESFMDNSPMHDEAPFDEEKGQILSADVGLNSWLAFDGENLAAIARDLGKAEIAERLEKQVAAHKARIAEHLWDEQRQVFANRMLSGKFVDALTPTSFLPLVAGIGSKPQVKALLEKWLNNPAEFGGGAGLPASNRGHPSFHDNMYWRGRIWGPLNFWTWLALKRAGEEQDATKLAEKSWRLFKRHWQDRICGENFNADSGDVMDQPDTDPFFTFGVMLAVPTIQEHLTWTPWAGWTVTAPPAGASLGPILTPKGLVRLEVQADGWRIVDAAGSVLRQGKNPESNIVF